MRALVVDDSRAIRAAMHAILASVGFSVVEADDGQEALAVLEKDANFDLALIDWFMPHMDGLSLVKAIRKEPSYANIRIMMVTSADDTKWMKEAMDAGAQTYLMKPFVPEIVISILRKSGLIP